MVLPIKIIKYKCSICKSQYYHDQEDALKCCEKAQYNESNMASLLSFECIECSHTHDRRIDALICCRDIKAAIDIYYFCHKCKTEFSSKLRAKECCIPEHDFKEFDGVEF